VSFELEQGEILGLIGPNGSGKSTTFNVIAGHVRADLGVDPLRWGEIGGLPPTGSATRHRAHLPDPAAVPQAVDPRERDLPPTTAPSSRMTARREPRARPRRRSADRPAERDPGRGRRPRRRRPEEARDGPRARHPAALLLADESLGGLDEAEMEQAADMLRASATSAASPSSGSSTSWAC
jgi:branched-chain amino acid transport system ATP-binding protein